VNAENEGDVNAELRLVLDNGGAPTAGAPAQAMTLTAAEVGVLRAIWRNEARIDWAAYDRLKERVLGEE